MKEMKTIKFPGDPEPWEIVDAKARTSIGDLTQLNTEDKTNLVAAVNEVAKGLKKSYHPTVVQGTFASNGSPIGDSDSVRARFENHLAVNATEIDISASETYMVGFMNYDEGGAYDGVDYGWNSITEGKRFVPTGAYFNMHFRRTDNTSMGADDWDAISALVTIYDASFKTDIEALKLQFAKIEVRDSDPEEASMYDGRMWILAVPVDSIAEFLYLPQRGIMFENGLIHIDSSTNRMVYVGTVSDGVAPALIDAVGRDVVYYPIVIPSEATSVTINCGDLYWGINGFNVADGVYARGIDPGWKASGATATFEAGASQYAVIVFKKSDGSAFDATVDTSAFTITFA